MGHGKSEQIKPSGKRKQQLGGKSVIRDAATPGEMDALFFD